VLETEPRVLVDVGVEVALVIGEFYFVPFSFWSMKKRKRKKIPAESRGKVESDEMGCKKTKREADAGRGKLIIKSVVDRAVYYSCWTKCEVSMMEVEKRKR